MDDELTELVSPKPLDTLTATGLLLEYVGVIAATYGIVTGSFVGLALGPPLYGMGKGILLSDYRAELRLLRYDLKQLTADHQRLQGNIKRLTLEDKLSEGQRVETPNI